MDSLQDDDAGSSTVLITVLSATPMRAGKLFALASVTINVGGVLVEIHGIRATRTATGATRIELPTFRDATGQSRVAIVLPEEIYGPIGEAVLEVLIERGIAKRRFATPHLEQLSAQSSRHFAPFAQERAAEFRGLGLGGFFEFCTHRRSLVGEGLSIPSGSTPSAARTKIGHGKPNHGRRGWRERRSAIAVN
jgi:hypothetical protein